MFSSNYSSRMDTEERNKVNPKCEKIYKTFHWNLVKVWNTIARRNHGGTMERRNLCGFSAPRIHGWKGRKKILFARADPAQWSANGLSKRRAQITRFALSRSLNQGCISTIYAWSKIANFRFFHYFFSSSSSSSDRSTRKWRCSGSKQDVTTPDIRKKD